MSYLAESVTETLTERDGFSGFKFLQKVSAGWVKGVSSCIAQVLGGVSGFLQNYPTVLRWSLSLHATHQVRMGETA